MRFVTRCLKQLTGLAILVVVVMLTSYHDTLTDQSARSVRFLAQYYANISHRYITGASGSDRLEIKRTPLKEFENRKRRVLEVCNSTVKVGGKIHGVFTHDKSGVIYCFVPKAGCTFWKRVFNFLNDEKINNSYKSVFSIPRHLVHSLSNGKGTAYDVKRHSPEKYPNRLVVTRDPISRMLSSYLDKIYLPDFWRQNGINFMKMARVISKKQEFDKIKSDFNNSKTMKKIEKIQPGQNGIKSKDIATSQRLGKSDENKGASNKDDISPLRKDFLRYHFDAMAMKFNPKFNPKFSSTADDVRCGKYLTFSEFVVTSLNDREPHWMPIHQLCNPCQFLPTHLSRMDTFTRDARVVLSTMGLEDILDDFDTVAQTNEEISMLVEYHFTRVFHSKLKGFYKKCISPKELAYRLWQNFRWRGYIHPQVNYVIPNFSEENKVKKDFLVQVWSARNLAIAKPSVMKETKNNYVKKFFSTLTIDVFNRLVQKYELDLKLFGYESLVAEMRHILT